MTLTYLNIDLIKYFENTFLTMRYVVSLNSVILRHVGVISHQKRQLQNLTKWILLAHYVQRHTCVLQSL